VAGESSWVSLIRSRLAHATRAVQFNGGASLRLPALLAILVGVVGASWSWRLLQWYISANTLTACILGTQCPLVFQASFSYFYGVPIHLLAIGWFSLMTVLAGLRAFDVRGSSAIGLIVGSLCVPAIVYLDYTRYVQTAN
jgi:uncharacterized membrane protein